jgi:hypothetical protein
MFFVNIKVVVACIYFPIKERPNSANYDSFRSRQTKNVDRQLKFCLTPLAYRLRMRAARYDMTSKETQTVAKRKALRDVEQSIFTEATLASLAKDLKSRRLPLDRQVISDDLVTGLRAVIRKDGGVTYHASYHLGDERPFLKLGVMDPKDPEHISLEDARELTKTIKALADKGIDPQDGLHRRLIKELKEKGTRWRP